MPLFSQYSDTIARSLLLSMGELFELQERSFITTGAKTLRLRPPYVDASPNLFEISSDINRLLSLERLTIIKPDGTSRDWGSYAVTFLGSPATKDSPFTLDIDGDTNGDALDADNDIVVFYYQQISVPRYDPIPVYGVYDNVIRQNTETSVEVVVQHPNVMMAFKDINAIDPVEAPRSTVLDKARWDVIRQRTGRVYEIVYIQLDEVSTCRYLLRSID